MTCFFRPPKCASLTRKQEMAEIRTRNIELVGHIEAQRRQRAEMELTIDTQATALQHARQVVATKTQIISDQDMKLEAWLVAVMRPDEQKIEKLETEINLHKSTIQERDAQLSALQHPSSGLVVGREPALKARDDTIASQEDTIRLLRETIADLKETVQNLKDSTATLPCAAPHRSGAGAWREAEQ